MLTKKQIEAIEKRVKKYLGGDTKQYTSEQICADNHALLECISELKKEISAYRDRLWLRPES